MPVFNGVSRVRRRLSVHTALLTVVCGAMVFAAERSRTVEVVAHRGASHDAPENTVAAIRLAWEQQADGVEFDVYLTKDGRIAVMHDKDTKRTTGGAVNRMVAGCTLAELRRLDVGGWKGPQFAGERIPDLAEALAPTPDGKRVFIEVKCGPEIVPELDRVLRASQLAPAQTAVISFNADVVEAVKKARPDLKAYWIVSLKKDQPPTAESLIARTKAIHADGLDLSAVPALDRAYADKIHAAGIPLYVWTVNDAALARDMLKLGVLGITTDRPGWLRSELGL